MAIFADREFTKCLVLVSNERIFSEISFGDFFLHVGLTEFIIGQENISDKAKRLYIFLISALKLRNFYMELVSLVGPRVRPESLNT